VSQRRSSSDATRWRLDTWSGAQGVGREGVQVAGLHPRDRGADIVRDGARRRNLGRLGAYAVEAEGSFVRGAQKVYHTQNFRECVVSHTLSVGRVRKAGSVQRGMARGTAPATAGRDCSSARSAMADTSMIPSPSRPAAHAAGSHPWATSSPSVEIRVLITSGAALSHRARDLNMAVSSHRLCFKLQQLTSSAPRRILPTFLTRN